MTKTEHHTTENASTISRRSRWLSVLGMTVLLAAGVIFGATNTDFGRDQVRGIVEERVSDLLQGADLSIGRLDGNLLRGLSAHDVLLSDSTGRAMLQVDRLAAQYRLLPLLRSRAELPLVEADRIVIDAAQRTDSLWDWSTLLAPSEEESSWHVVVDSMSFPEVVAEARFLSTAADSVLRIRELDLRLVGLDLPPDGALALRQLDLQTAFQAPALTDTVLLDLSGAFADDVVVLDTLSLVSIRSHVVGAGRIDLAHLPSLTIQRHAKATSGAMDGTADGLEHAPSSDSTARAPGRLILQATPLALADIAAFAPGLRSNALLTARLEANQSTETTSMDFEIAVAGGGAVAGAGSWTETATGTRLSARLDLVDLAPGRLLEAGAGTGPLRGSAEITMEGVSLDSLDGRFRATLEPFNLGTDNLGQTTLQGQAEAGVFAADMNSTVNGAGMAFRLGGRWLDEQPVFEVDGHVEGFNVAPWLEGDVLSSDVDMAVRAGWSGLDIALAAGEASIEFLPSRFGGAENVQGAVTMTMAGGNLDWQIAMSPQQGTLESSGRLSLAGAMAISGMQTWLSGMDVSAFTADNPDVLDSRVTAALSGSVSLEAWQVGSGDLALELDSVRWGGLSLPHANGNARWRGGRASVAFEAAPSDSSRVASSVTARANGRNTRIDLESMAWSNLDLGKLTGMPVPSSDLAGTGQGRIDMVGATVQQVNATLRSESSRWGIQHMSDILLEVEATRDRLEVTGSGKAAPEEAPGTDPSSWQLEAVVTQWQEAVMSVDGTVLLDRIDPAAFAGTIDPGTALSGRARATGTLRDGFPESAEFEVEFDPSSLRGEAVALARIDGSLTDSLLTAQARLGVAEGVLEGNLSARLFDETPSFSSSGMASQLNILPLLGRSDVTSDVNLTWEISGSSFDPTVAEWHLLVEGAPSQLDALEIEELSLDAGWDGRVLDVTNLSSRFNEGSMQVNGRINLDPERSNTYSDLRATWFIGNLQVFERLAQFERLASRAGTMDLQVFGPAGELDAELIVSLSDLELDTWKLSSFEASTWVTLDDEMLPISTEASIDIGYVALPTLSVRTTSLEVGQRGDVFTVLGAAMVDTGNRLSLAANVNPFAARPWMTLRTMDVLLGGRTFALERPASLVVADGWQLNRLSLVAPTQAITVAGGLDDSTGYALQIDLDAFDMAPIGQLTGFPELEGRLGATLLLSGEAEAPLIDSRIDLTLQDAGAELAQVLAHLQSTPQGLKLDSSVLTEGAANLTVQGFIPVFAGVGIADEERADREADLNLSIVSSGGSVRWIAPFLDPTFLTDVEGRATAEIQVSGSIEDPFLTGFLDLDQARFRLPEYGVTYRMDRFRSTLQGVTLTLQEARVRSGDGSMDITGSIDFASLTNSSFDLQAQLNRFRAVRNEELHTTLSGDLQLTGRTTRPDLAGQLTTSNTSFWITDTAGGDLLQVPLSFDDEVMLADNFGYRAVVADTLADAIWRGLSMDLSVVLERDTWIRQRVNPEMAIELSGRVDVQKDRGQDDLNLYRSIEVVPDRSTIKQFGRKFRIAEGVASFNGPIEEMLLQVEAEYEVPSRLNPGQPEVVITLRLDGRLDDLEFDLSSDPAMENTDIVSYIATGRPASESLQFGGSDFNNQVLVGVAATQLSGLVEGIASQSLGLDVVDIEQDGLKGTRLTAGKYVTPRLFVGVTQPITFSGGSSALVEEQRELTLEYKVLEYLLLQLLADASDSPVRVNLAGRYSF